MNNPRDEYRAETGKPYLRLDRGTNRGEFIENYTKDYVKWLEFTQSAPHMPQKSIGDYLESGSLGLFAQQIVESLQGAVSVAIHDTEGQLVWAGPNETDSGKFAIEPPANGHRRGTGFRKQLDELNLVYVFYLGSEDSGELIGTLSVIVQSSNPVTFEYAQSELQPILTCIERQVAINAELSSVRRISTEGRDGLELLVKMDELDSSAGTEKNLQSVLKLAAAHFGCQLAAISLPELDVQQTYQANEKNDTVVEERLVTLLAGLNTAAREHKKVLVSDDTEGAKTIDGGNKKASNVLCSPIVDSHDEIAGIFVLIGNQALPKDSIRLARAICAKINLLTGVADPVSNDQLSRNRLLHYMNSVLKEHPDTPHAFLYLDIDKLHVVNDSFGNMAGDHVISKIIDIIDDLAGDDDAISHFSGGRFGVFLCNCDEKNALAKANHILKALDRDSIEFEGLTINVSTSIGVAITSSVVTDAAAALSTAEVAARSAKDRGGGRAVVFRDIDASVMQRRSDLDQVGHLQAAFIENRFVLYAQAIQSLQSNESSSRFEILVRMLDEDGQLLLPEQFLPAAERYQLMIAMDRWVVNQTLDELSNSNNMPEISLANFSINVSAQSVADDDFIDYLTRCIAESGVSPEALCFEITETALVRNLDQAHRFIRNLTKLGCRLALDDFGTGHCSFAYLKDLPVQYIKIDGVFIRDILDNPLSEAIVSSVTNIAKVMHAYTVAEHVENDRVLERLRDFDIDYVQGFAIARPKPLADVLAELGPAVLFDTTTILVGRTT